MNDVGFIVQTLLTGVVAILAFFLSRLVKKLDDLDRTINQSFPRLEKQIQLLEEWKRDLNSEIKSIDEIKKDVSILKYVVNEIKLKLGLFSEKYHGGE